MKDHGRRMFVTTALALGLVALLHSEAAAAIALVQNIGSAESKATGTSLSITVGSGVAAGDSIIVSFAMQAVAGTPTVSDGSNTYTLDASVTNVGNVSRFIFSAHNVAALAGGSPITVTHPSVAARAMSASEFSGLKTTATLDQTATGTGSSTAPSTQATPLPPRRTSCSSAPSA